ncbi:hypothetical protein [Micromonospora sp. NPDC005979]|uniref:hypothetical protein n=1 Tax=Micromonospora sp. NPDC005979 TaxID=3156726 RepID=UPI0033AD5CFA
MAHKYLSLRPSQVVLDPENPRLPDGTTSDREAINRLLDDDADDLIALARDMAKSGQTNPAELPIVIKDKSKYLVLEGNRRFAALKLLADPILADDEVHQKAFRRAAALGAPPKSVFTLIADSREEADYWIVLRHTGENNGRGIKRWSAAQSATHRRRNNKSVDSGTIRSMAMADELVEAYSTDPDLVDLVVKTRNSKLTNIGRFFSPDVLDRLHFSLRADGDGSSRERSLWVHHDRDTLRPFFWWAFSLILEKPVDAYKNKAIRKTALLSVANLLPLDSDATAHPFRLAEGGRSENASADGSTATDGQAPSGEASHSGPGASTDGGGGTSTGPENSSTAGGNGEASSGTNSTNARTRGRNEAKPEKYMFQGLRLPNHPGRIQKLLKECRLLEIDDMSSVVCVMVRITVELALSTPEALRLSGVQERDSLKKKIIAMLKFLDPNIEDARKRDKTLEQAYLDASGLGMEYLNGFVHNPDVIPDPHLARRYSAAYRPLLERLDNAL